MISIAIGGAPNGTGSATGAINFADEVDRYNIVLRGGELYEFQANSTSSLDPTLTLNQPIGAPIFNDDVDGANNRNSRILFRAGPLVPGPSADHRLDVAAYNNASTGSFQLFANEVPGNTGTYSTLSVNGSNTGDLHVAGDQDFHRITLVAGRTYRFNLNGADFGSGALADPYLELRSGFGAIILREDDDSGGGHNSQLTFTAPTSGTYFANARAYIDAGSGGYRLSATQIA
jgi:hypothetical protein